MNAELLSGIVGVALSLALSYVPGLKTWWQGLSSGYKQGWMGLLLVVSAAVLYLGVCQGWWVLEGAACGDLTVFGKALLFAGVANQSIYPLTKKKG